MIHDATQLRGFPDVFSALNPANVINSAIPDSVRRALCFALPQSANTPLRADGQYDTWCAAVLAPLSQAATKADDYINAAQTYVREPMPKTAPAPGAPDTSSAASMNSWTPEKLAKTDLRNWWQWSQTAFDTVPSTAPPKSNTGLYIALGALGFVFLYTTGARRR